MSEKMAERAEYEDGFMDDSKATEAEETELYEVKGPGSVSLESEGGDENTERGNWGTRVEFILSCVGYAVGLGNIWRFPYLCYRSGGGAFLIPYIIFLVLCGMPLVYLEMSIGQFASQGTIGVWRISPIFSGIGWGMVIICGLVCVYYNIILTWTLYYLFVSFTDVLPWSTCGDPWSNELCALRKNSNSTNETLMLGNWSRDSDLRDVLYQLNNSMRSHVNFTNANLSFESPSQQFWQRHVLQITDGIENTGVVRWQLLLCLVAAWIVIYFCLMKGIKSSGKVVYVTATFPYVILIVLCVRGLTLPGAIDGITFYLSPDWSKLAEFKVWGDAACQIFYSVGVAWGGMITMASYNKFNHKVHQEATIIPLINCGTSMFAGLVIFSIIGFMAHETGLSVEEVATQGPGLIFVVYPEALAKLPISPLWSVLFFLMVFTVGLDTQFAMFETVTSACLDTFPILKKRKLIFTLVLCVVAFLLGIPMVTQGGIYILQIMDWYSSVFSLMVLSLLESVIIGWVYGADRFFTDIELMIGRKPFIWYKICWCFITPATMMFVLMFTFVTHTPVTYNDYVYPDWAIAIGWLLALMSLAPLPVVAGIQIYRAEGSLLERIRELSRPDPKWGPAVTEFRQLYIDSLPLSERKRMVRNIMSPKSYDCGSLAMLDRQDETERYLKTVV